MPLTKLSGRKSENIEVKPMDIKEQRERDKYKKTMSGGKEEKPFGSGKIKYWFTVKGKKVPVFDGETQEQALQRSVDKFEKIEDKDEKAKKEE